jgi:hypothetical protein
MKFHRLRILQAGGIGALIMWLLFFLGSFISELIGINSNGTLLTIILSAVIIGEIAIGYWIGKHVSNHLFFHVFLANILIMLSVYIINRVVGNDNIGKPVSGLVPSIIIAWPTAILVRKRIEKRTITIR